MLFYFKSKITDKEYYEFYKFHLLKTPEGRGSIVIARLILPALLILFFLLPAFMRSKDFADMLVDLLFYAAISALWFFAVMPLLLLSVRINMKLMKMSGKQYRDDLSIQFYDDHFIVPTESNDSKIKYTNIKRIAVGDNAIYIYATALLAYIIPFSVFESNKHKALFLTFIKNISKNTKASKLL